MSQTAANLVDLVLPDQPIRQWVISLPFALRLPVARDSALLSGVLRIVVSELDRLMKRLGQQRGVLCGATGMVSATQFFGGSLNLNPTSTCSYWTAFSARTPGMSWCSHPARSPAQGEVRELAERVHRRVLRMLRRRGLLRDEPDDNPNTPLPEPIEACAQLSLRLGKLGHVDARGVVREPDDDEARLGQRSRSPWSGEHEGWNVHAAVTVERGDADGRERLWV